MLDKNEVEIQSKRAYNAWKDLWRRHSLIVKEQIHDKLPMEMFRNHGIGKQCLLVSMGGSFEDQIEYLKKNQDKVDIFCVDKAYGHLIQHGIIPQFCLVADAQVSFEVYLEPYLDMTTHTVLVANVNSNPLWGLNWKGHKTYYVNKDNIESEKEFSTISGVTDLIPAGSNVSNAMGVYATTVMNYDHYILLGYDFCWDIEGTFYAFSEGTEKTANKSKLLNQVRPLDNNMDMVATSENLWFSARWFDSWMAHVGVNKFTNCSNGILKAIKFDTLYNMLNSIKQYKRDLTYDEHVIANKRVLNINSPQAYMEARKILSDDSVNVIDGQIIFQTPEDHKNMYSQDTKHSLPNIPQQNLDVG